MSIRFAPNGGTTHSGYFFFTGAVNLARHLGVEPESALNHASRKFERRFRYIEEQVAESDRQLDECALQELDALWDEAKIVLKSAT